MRKVRFRPLEWNEAVAPKNWYAPTAVGEWWIEKKKKYWLTFELLPILDEPKYFDTLEDAMKAAQMHHDAIVSTRVIQ